MISTNELMLSDWVWQDGCTRPSQVAGLSSGKIHTWWADGTKHAKDAYYFSPIDITPARLEANGWKVIRDMKNEDTRENWVAIYEDEGIRITLDNSCIYIYVKVTGAPRQLAFPLPHFIHELQQIFRFAGRADLADNFKLD